MTQSEAIATMRSGIKHTPRGPTGHRPGPRLWALLHAQSLLDGPGSGALAMALPEDDHSRLAIRRRESLERRS